jgi:hypothetical protein
MKPMYVVTTGILFGLVTVAHLLRMVLESRALAADPGYLLLTAAAAALSVWACVLITRRAR